MTSTDSSDRRASLKASLLERLHDPLQLRICVIAVVLVTAYMLVYQPMSDRIDATTRQIQRDQKLLNLASSIEQLEKQYHAFEDRLPQQVDMKEWVQYVLEGIRGLPLKMLRLDCRAPRKVGPYQAISLQLDLEGSFFDLDKFLRWLESNQRLLRADDIRLTPTKGGMVMQVSILGMTD